MIEVVDRVPTYPNRIKITHSNGTSEYVTWERADAPTVEGTPINKALFDSILSETGLRDDTTVYVSKAGSDALGDGTAANPYASIMKALETLPKQLNGKNVIVNVGAGTYNETVSIEDFASGVITINGDIGAGVTITGLTVQNSAVLIDSISLTVRNGGIFVGSQGMLFSATSNITVDGGADGVILRYGATLEVTTTLTINNTSARALYVQYASSASVATLAGSGNNIGVHVYNSVVHIYNSTLTASIYKINDNGAIFERGAVG